MSDDIQLRSSVLLSLQGALLGEVSSALRGVSVEWDARHIHISCVFDGSISPEDSESMECVETEVLAAFPDHDVTLELASLNAPAPLPSDGVWVYRRREVTS